MSRAESGSDIARPGKFRDSGRPPDRCRGELKPSSRPMPAHVPRGALKGSAQQPAKMRPASCRLHPVSARLPAGYSGLTLDSRADFRVPQDSHRSRNRIEPVLDFHARGVAAMAQGGKEVVHGILTLLKKASTSHGLIIVPGLF